MTSSRFAWAAPRRVTMPWAQTFGDVAAGEPLLYEDSYGRLCIAQNQGNAAEALSVPEGDDRARVRRERRRRREAQPPETPAPEAASSER